MTRKIGIRPMGVAILLLALIGAACSNTGDGDAATTDAPPLTSIESSVTTTVAPTSTPTPTSTTSEAPTVPTNTPTTTSTTEAPPRPQTLAELEWRRVDDDDLIGPGIGEMASVVAGASGLVAVGPAGSNGAVWISSDGVEWERVEDGSFGGPGRRELNGVAAGGPGYVIVGSEFLDETGASKAAAWVSSDGTQWERAFGWELDADPAFAEEMWSVVAGGPGLVAVGTSQAEESTANNAMAWVSSDGRSWERVAGAVLSGPGGIGVDNVGDPNVVEWDSQVFAAGPRAVGGELNGAVFWSPDGLDWERIERQAFTNPRSEMIRALTVGGPGLVAVGMSEEDGMAWVSSDGFAWERAAKATLGGPGTQLMSSATATELGLVAVGEETLPEGGTCGVAWISEDGLSWDRLSTPVFGCGEEGEHTISSVITSGSMLIAVGGSSQGAAVWVAELP